MSGPSPNTLTPPRGEAQAVAPRGGWHPAEGVWGGGEGPLGAGGGGGRAGGLVSYC